jgi:peroxiredoxin
MQVIGISQDDEQGTGEFRKEFGISFPTLIDPSSRGYAVSNDYGITTVPSLFLVQADGEISAAWSGWSKRDMAALGQIAGVSPFEPGEKVPEWKGG